MLVENDKITLLCTNANWNPTLSILTSAKTTTRTATITIKATQIVHFTTKETTATWTQGTATSTFVDVMIAVAIVQRRKTTMCGRISEATTSTMRMTALLLIRIVDISLIDNKWSTLSGKIMMSRAISHYNHRLMMAIAQHRINRMRSYVQSRIRHLQIGFSNEWQELIGGLSIWRSGGLAFALWASLIPSPYLVNKK